MGIVRDEIRENNFAELDEGAVFRPMNRCVVYDIVMVCYLYQKLKAYRAFSDSLCEFVKEEICILALGGGVIQMVVPGVWCDSVAAKAAYPILVSESHRGHTKVRLSCKAGRTWLGGLHECEGSGMTPEEDLDGRWRRFGRIACSNSAKELEKLLTCSGRESVSRMADNVGVHMFSEIEAKSESARICVGITIRDHRNGCGVREPHGHWCRVAGDVRRPCQGSRFGRGCKCSREHDPFCMSGPKARVQSKNRVELLEHVLA